MGTGESITSYTSLLAGTDSVLSILITLQLSLFHINIPIYPISHVAFFYTVFWFLMIFYIINIKLINLIEGTKHSIINGYIYIYIGYFKNCLYKNKTKQLKNIFAHSSVTESIINRHCLNSKLKKVQLQYDVYFIILLPEITLQGGG